MPNSGVSRGAVFHGAVSRYSAALYDTLVRSHCWVALAVTSLASFSAHELEFQPSLAALGVVFFSTLLIYNLDTAIDLLAVRDELQARQTRATRLAWLSLAGVLGLLATMRWATSALVMGGAAVCCLYAVPLGPRGFRMKALPGAKSIVVGSAVAIAVVCVPLIEHGIAWTPLAWSTLACVGTLTIVNATLFDVRDLEQDRARGLSTLPVLLGLKATRILLCVGATACFGAVAKLEPLLRQTAWLMLGALLPLILSLGPRSPKSAYSWLVDGALFIPWFFSLG